MALAGCVMHPLMAAELEVRSADPLGFAGRQLVLPMVAEVGLVLAATQRIRMWILEDAPSRRSKTVRPPTSGPFFATSGTCMAPN